MLNGVNLGEDFHSKQLDSQVGGVGAVVTNPINNPYKNIDRNLLIDETVLSNEAVNLYQKEQDIRKFSTLVMSDPQDLSHEAIIDNLFSEGVCDPLSDEIMSELANNKNLLKDLSF